LPAPPPVALAAYQTAASRQNTETPACGITWPLLAAIGQIESHHATSGGSNRPGWNGIANPAILGPLLNGGSTGMRGIRDTDHGKLDGNKTWDRAVGPMQFLPGTWRSFGVDADADGVANPQDIRDASAAAARYLCKNGAHLNDPVGLATAIYSYNAADWYVADVQSLAARYAGLAVTAPGSDAAVTIAIAFAYAHIGDPYRWGGNGPLYDCSGFVQAAYRLAGVSIPRTSEQQWLRLPHVADGQLRIGDLVFFNPGEFLAGLPGHVGIYVGNGYMIDDPHTGALVRVERITGFGEYVGAARPALLPFGSIPGVVLAGSGNGGSGNNGSGGGSTPSSPGPTPDPGPPTGLPPTTTPPGVPTPTPGGGPGPTPDPVPDPAPDTDPTSVVIVPDASRHRAPSPTATPTSSVLTALPSPLPGATP
jgi:cell wall-associated NlpC family hydrolase